MNVANVIDINIFSLVILAFIFSNTNKRAEHAFTQHRLFIAIVGTLALLLVDDTVTRLVDGLQGSIFLYLNWASTMLLYLLAPIIPLLYVFYTDYQVYHDEKRFRRIIWPVAAFVLLDATFNLSSVITGWTFTIDINNVYHRGPLIALHTISCYSIFVYTVIFIIRNKKKVDDRHYATLLAFGIPTVIGGMLQGWFYGLALIFSGLTLSVLMLYFNIQDKRLDTDYLTGAYNRRLLDSYVEKKIQSSTKNHTFSAILLDLDGFKEINDGLGHIAGDNALLDAVGLLRKCLRSNDFMARYGGDEFLIVLDIDSKKVLKEAVDRIRNCCKEFNQGSAKPYTLSFSMGFAVYDIDSNLSTEGFLKHIDMHMYQQKKQAASCMPAKTVDI